jgi:hypothetical protein
VDVSELAALVGETPASLAEIEYVFRALVGYPYEAGEIAGASPENLLESLQRCCNALTTADDKSELPNALWQRVANRVSRETTAPGGTYARAAALVVADQGRWEEMFSKYGRGDPTRAHDLVGRSM